jgi:hypothetical protein
LPNDTIIVAKNRSNATNNDLIMDYPVIKIGKKYKKKCGSNHAR